MYNTSLMIEMNIICNIVCLLGSVVSSAGLSDTPAHAQSDPNQVWTAGAVPKAEPNAIAVKLDPNTPVYVVQKSDPKSAKQTQFPISGTLALNWLYQGKEPPKPQVGNEKVTVEAEIRPWPYYCYDNDWLYDRPWLNSYGYWSRYRDNFNTYPVNHAAVRMSLDASMTFEFGGCTPYDLAGPYYRP